MLPLASINAQGLPEPDVVSLHVVTFNRLLIHIPHIMQTPLTPP